jgi:gamma-glutamyltranspeptidase / glutathione hydrolase
MHSHDSIRDRRRFLVDLSSGSLAFASFVLTDLASAQDRSHAKSTVARGSRGVVATVHPLASQAGMAAFERGGNAFDAAVAASLMLSVVDGHNSGLGGGCLALLKNNKLPVLAIDGRERAPMSATPEMFYRDGKPEPLLSQLGPLAAGVPGLVAALDHISSKFGKIGWRDALIDAAKVAQDGFAIDATYAGNLRSTASELRKFPESKRVLLDANGQPLAKGTVLKQPDLANTLEHLTSEGAAWFYQGAFAQTVAMFMKETGGIIAAEDFKNYKVALRDHIQSKYRGHTIVGFPPPSSGGIHIAQMLGMLGGFDVRKIFAQSTATGIHLLLEVMKRAMADRAYWLGDSDHAPVPAGLLDAEYLRMRANDIDLEKATVVSSHGQPPNAMTDLIGREKHTTHLTAADSEGNVIALTQTVNTSFGCKMIVPGTGVILNNEMDDFAIAPGVRNAFGLVGAEGNAVAPGKRPLSSMSPTIVLDENGKPVFSCGAAGGPKIITTTLQVLVRVLDLGQSIDEAIAAPRVHHQWSPDNAVCEEALDAGVVRELETKGHVVKRIGTAAIAQGVALNHDGSIKAASDPRVGSSALAR